MKVYIAGPVSGGSAASVMAAFDQRALALQTVCPSVVVLNPMSGKAQRLAPDDQLQGSEAHRGDPFLTDHAIYRRDMWMVHQADVVIADVAGCTHTSAGTVAEIVLADQLGKLVIVAGRAAGGPMDHAFVNAAASVFVPTFSDAVGYLHQILSARSGRRAREG